MEAYSSLPEEADQDWLLDQLAGIIRACGATRMLTAPLTEPDDRFFPDRWEPTAEGARALLTRLLRYAGLGRLDLRLWVGEYTRATGSVDPRTGAHGREGALAWFAGIDRRTCLFGVDEAQLPDAEGLAGALAHEIAHAWRTHHGLVVANAAVEEQLTDVTTVYLGFGVLTTNASSRHRSRGFWQEGRGYMHEWSHKRAGYLPPEAMSFLLAAYCVARAFGPNDRREIASVLEPNQSHSFEVAWTKLAALGDALADRLGVPHPDAWPEPVDPETFARDGGASGVCEAPLESATSGVASLDLPRCAPAAGSCRVQQTPTPHGTQPEEKEAEALTDVQLPIAPREVRSWAVGLGTLGAAIGAAIANFMESWTLAGVPVTPSMGLLGGVIVGGALGRRFRRVLCGSPHCGAPASPDGETCSRCGTLLLDADHPWLPRSR